MPAAKDQVLPLLKAAVDATRGPELILDAKASPVLRSFVGRLLVSYVVDEGDVLRFLTPVDLRRARLSVDGVHRRALANLDRRARGGVRVAPSGDVHAVLFDGNFEATLMLLPGFWEHLHASLGARVAAVAPARDVLAVCSAGSKRGVRGLRRVVDRVSSNGDHLLTREVFVHAEGAWGLIASEKR